MSLSRRIRRRLPRCEGTGIWSYEGTPGPPGPFGGCLELAESFFVTEKRPRFDRPGAPVFTLLAQCKGCEKRLPDVVKGRRVDRRALGKWREVALIYSTMEG